jgi:hypothetical protein
MDKLFLSLIVEVVEESSSCDFASPLKLTFELALDILEFALGVRKVCGAVVQH